MSNWNDPMLPTPSLDEYAELAKLDPNLWWRMGPGHHRNLFDAALEEIEQLRKALEPFAVTHRAHENEYASLCGRPLPFPNTPYQMFPPVGAIQRAYEALEPKPPSKAMQQAHEVLDSAPLQL